MSDLNPRDGSYYYKYWGDISLSLTAVNEFELSTYTDIPSWVGVAVESQNDDLDNCKVPINYQTLKDMEVAFTHYIVMTN